MVCNLQTDLLRRLLRLLYHICKSFICQNTLKFATKSIIINNICQEGHLNQKNCLNVWRLSLSFILPPGSLEDREIPDHLKCPILTFHARDMMVWYITENGCPYKSYKTLRQIYRTFWYYETWIIGHLSLHIRGFQVSQRIKYGIWFLS